MVVLVLLLVVAPLVELYVIIQVAHVIGGWDTIALLLVESMFGAWVVKRQGLSVLARIQTALAERRMPDKELVDGLLVLMAGLLMIAPGFITDVMGFLLLFPPTRAPVRALILRRWRRGAPGRLITMAGGTRFVGTFRVGSAAPFDTTGHDQTRSNPPHPELDQ